MENNRSLDATYVRSLLYYDKNSGDFTWLVSRGSVKSGRRAGTINPGRNGRSYFQIKIDRKF